MYYYYEDKNKVCIYITESKLWAEVQKMALGRSCEIKRKYNEKNSKVEYHLIIDA